MSAERNKARMLELIERVLNGHDVEALPEYTSNPSVVGAASGLVSAFPDLVAAWVGSWLKVGWSPPIWR